MDQNIKQKIAEISDFILPKKLKLMIFAFFGIVFILLQLFICQKNGIPLILLAGVMAGIWFGWLTIKLIESKSGINRLLLAILEFFSAILFFVFIFGGINQKPSGARDTAIKGTLDSLRAVGEMSYDGNRSSYSGLENAPDTNKIKQAIENYGGIFALVVSPDGQKYCSQAKLAVGEGYYCVDFKGFLGGSTCSSDFSCEESDK